MSTMQQQHVWVSRTVKDACRHVLLMGEGGGHRRPRGAFRRSAHLFHCDGLPMWCER